MFDYKKFEDDTVLALENALKKWAQEHEDIYILMLDCACDAWSVGIEANTKHYLSEKADIESEEYWYYKYCETEWELFDMEGPINGISSYIRKYVEENDKIFSDPETFVYLPTFDEHCNKLTEACKKALLRFKQLIAKDFPDLLLDFNVPECLDGQDRAEFFAFLNGQEAAQEYAEHVEEFN